MTHQKYHPKDIYRATIQQTFKKTFHKAFGDFLDIDEAMVA